jgi:CspA family cold shock protein
MMTIGRIKGLIKWFNAEEQCGFVRPEDGSQGAFLYLSEFREQVDASQLLPGYTVEYRVEEAVEGSRAVDVVLLEQESPNTRLQGSIKWFDHKRQYGFIQRDDELADLFVHFNSFRDSTGTHLLAEGDSVEFQIERTPKGYQAVDVVLLENKTSNGRSTGHIKQFFPERRFGFLQCEDGHPDVFAHTNDFRDPSEAYWLNEGDSVEFRIEQAPKGPRAVDIVVLNTHQSSPEHE